MNLRINQGQAIRSVLGCSRVTHFTVTPYSSPGRCLLGRVERSAAGQLVDPGGHDEVVAGEPADRVGREPDDESAPSDLQLRVVALRLGQQGDPRGSPKAALNVVNVNSRRISPSSICHSPATPAASEPASSAVSGGVPARISEHRSRASDSGVIGAARRPLMTERIASSRRTRREGYELAARRNVEIVALPTESACRFDRTARADVGVEILVLP
jgi:hypothetical protein